MVLFYAKSTQTTFTLKDFVSGNYYSYTSNKVNEDSINLGFCYLNKNTENKNLIGESITTTNLEIGNLIKKLKATILKTEYLSGTTIIYAHSPLINKSIKLQNNTNLQINKSKKQ